MLNPTRIIKSTSLKVAACASVLCIAALCKADEPSEPIEGYAFLGGNVSAYIKDLRFDVVSVDKKFLYLANGQTKKKAKLDTPCSIRIEPAFSQQLLDVHDLKFEYTSFAQTAKESRAIRDSLEFPDGQLNEAVRDMVNNQGFHNDAVVDTVHADFNLLPEQDITGAYCAIVVYYESIMTKTNKIKKPGAFVRVHYIGNLTQGEESKIRIQKRLKSFVVENARCELVFFNGKGDPIASSESRGLSRVNLESKPQ